MTLAVDGAETSESLIREVQATEILAKIQNGTLVEYDHVIVKGDLNLSTLDLPTKHVNRSSDWIGLFGLSETQNVVNSIIRINDSVFEGLADFSNTYINETVDLSGSSFTKDARFAGTNFSRTASFERTTFGGNAWFGGATFDGTTSFYWATFSRTASFERTTFSEYAWFYGATFSRTASFERTTFGEEVWFYGATFSEYARFDGATFGGDAWFYRATFSEDALFDGATFDGTTSFDEATFSRTASFERTTFSEDAWFGRATFNGDARFGGATFNENARFYGATFGGDARFGGATFSEYAWFDGATFEGYFFGWSAVKNTLTCDEATYLGLIKNFKDHGQFDEADDCYFTYRYRNMDNLLDLLGWISCGFGVRPMYAVYLSIILIVIFGFIYWIGDGIYKFSAQNPESSSDKARTRSLSIIWNFSFSEIRKIFRYIKYNSKKLFEYIYKFKPKSIAKIPDKLWRSSFTTNVSLKDALYFSALVFFTLHPPHDWEHSTRWRYVILFENILGGLFVTLFIVTLGNVIIR